MNGKAIGTPMPLVTKNYDNCQIWTLTTLNSISLFVEPIAIFLYLCCMFTQEQLKDINERHSALRGFL